MLLSEFWILFLLACTVDGKQVPGEPGDGTVQGTCGPPQNGISEVCNRDGTCSSI